MSQQEESSVELTDESLRIQNLEIEDEDVIDYLSDNDDRPLEELIRLSIKVGVSNLRLSDTSKEVEYIRHEFDKINRDLKDEIDELRDELDGWFDGEEGDFSEIIDETFGENGEVVDKVLDPNSEDTPIGELYNSIQEELQELREKFIEEDVREEVAEETTKKGEEFEDDLANMLEQVTQKSDEVKRTGEEHGQLDDRFVGDFVVTVGETQQDIVIEAKNVSQISKPNIKEELKDGMENRGADYGILVLRDEDGAPKKLGSFREFGSEMLYVAISDEDSDSYDLRILEVAYEWARMRTISEQLDVSDEVDPETVQNMVEKAEDELSRFQNLRSQCTNIKKARESIESDLDEIQDEIQEKLDRINSEVSQE